MFSKRVFLVLFLACLAGSWVAQAGTITYNFQGTITYSTYSNIPIGTPFTGQFVYDPDAVYFAESDNPASKAYESIAMVLTITIAGFTISELCGSLNAFNSIDITASNDYDLPAGIYDYLYMTKDSMDLIVADSHNTEISNFLELPRTLSGFEYVHLQRSDQFNHFDGTVLGLTAVPEPSEFLLLCISGIVGVIGYGCHRVFEYRRGRR